MANGYEVLITCPQATADIQYISFNQAYAWNAGWTPVVVSIPGSATTCQDINGNLTTVGNVIRRPLASGEIDYDAGGAAFAFGFIVPMFFYLIAKPIGAMFRLLKQS